MGTDRRKGGLFLKRKLGQSFSIDQGKITGTVVDIRGREVSIQFTGDRSVKIDRTEILGGKYDGQEEGPGEKPEGRET